MNTLLELEVLLNGHELEDILLCLLIFASSNNPYIVDHDRIVGSGRLSWGGVSRIGIVLIAFKALGLSAFHLFLEFVAQPLYLSGLVRPRQLERVARCSLCRSTHLVCLLQALLWSLYNSHNAELTTSSRIWRGRLTSLESLWSKVARW